MSVILLHSVHKIFTVSAFSSAARFKAVKPVIHILKHLELTASFCVSSQLKMKTGTYLISVPGFQYQIKDEKDINAGGYDCVVYTSGEPPNSDSHPEAIKSVLARASKLDEALSTEGGLFEVNLTAGRLVYSPTGPLSDYHDVRSYGEAVKQGILRAIKAGSKAPLLVLPQSSAFTHTQLVSVLGALEALYLSIQYREDCPDKNPKIKSLGVWGYKGSNADSFFKYVVALENGRCVCRDIGGGDPERMAPPRVVDYVKEAFPANSGISIKIEDQLSFLEKEYPLYAAVNRCASVVERHNGRVVYLSYDGGNATESLLLVGKGVTYDTGGADLKVNGFMAGMSRDKCGAAAVAGFMKVLSELKPANLKVIGALSLVRNSVGSNCYVSDEVIVARSKKRVRVNNTDAEGRMIMADVLCHMKELAQNLPNPHLMTVATLTGHACLAAGNGYSIVMDNAVAREQKFSSKLQEAGQKIGNPFEISYLRREDFKFHKGVAPGDDLRQSNDLPSSRTARGHQTPGAFLIMASGLDECDLSSDKPLKYSHVDIAASGGDLPNEATGAPVLAFAAHYLPVPA
uniref:Leucyl aminopeptidase n=1 Tax=Nilaparvata lugens TaxID=108931 RepID=A0A191UR80_NILLU|nr:leucyl aminopeptidase [Nilaparvata lugens]APA33971.1 seminal fluid protein [Nilaparvata lugens]